MMEMKTFVIPKKKDGDVVPMEYRVDICTYDRRTQYVRRNEKYIISSRDKVKELIAQYQSAQVHMIGPIMTEYRQKKDRFDFFVSLPDHDTAERFLSDLRGLYIHPNELL